MSTVDWKNLKEGEEFKFEVDGFTRTHFVKYAGAGGDFNPIHHDETFAKMAGLESVFGMGMLTAGILTRVPAEWFGPASVKKYTVSFRSRLWPGDNVTFSGKIVKLYEEQGVPHAELELSAVNQKGETLIRGSSVVRPWNPK
jgi:acyl dehydratase